jgi:hypothetical protein
MLVVRVTENVRAVQSSYYSSCPWDKLTKSFGMRYSTTSYADPGLLMQVQLQTAPVIFVIWMVSHPSTNRAQRCSLIVKSYFPALSVGLTEIRTWDQQTLPSFTMRTASCQSQKSSNVGSLGPFSPCMGDQVTSTPLSVGSCSRIL